MEFFRGKKGSNILTEQVIFLVLNLVFFSILLLFIFSKTSSVSVLEEINAKRIALMIDSAKEGTTFYLDLSDELGKAEKNGLSADEIVSFDENVVNVKLSSKSGYEYSFFNNVKVDVKTGAQKGVYIFKVDG